MSRPIQANTDPSTEDASDADHSEPTASLNPDGTLNWFIPPYVIPALIILLVAARAIWLS